MKLKAQRSKLKKSSKFQGTRSSRMVLGEVLELSKWNLFSWIFVYKQLLAFFLRTFMKFYGQNYAQNISTEGDKMRTTIKAATLFLSLVLTLSAQASNIEAVPGEYVVRLKNQSISTFSKQTLTQRLGAFVKSTVPSLNIVVVKMPVVQTTDSAIKSLNKNSLVAYSEPNYIYRANKVPNDAMYGQLWGMKNAGQKDSDGQVGIAGVDIDAEAAWDITTGNKKTLNT